MGDSLEYSYIYSIFVAWKKYLKTYNMENLYNWVINYNPYTKTWRGAKRENYEMLFSAINSPLVIKAKELDVLVDILRRTDGDTTKLNYIREI